jgi:sulfatase modifying factor 1
MRRPPARILSSVAALTLLVLAAISCREQDSPPPVVDAHDAPTPQDGKAKAIAPASQPGQAEKVARPGEERDDNRLKMKFRWCPPGRFRMGSPKDEPGRNTDEGPVQVTLSRGFWLGAYEVTQAQWREIMGTTMREQRVRDGEPIRPVGDGSTRDHVGEGPDYPMYFVSHADAEEFCRKLNDLERNANRLQADEAYALPTEAQWEYACRAGTTTATSLGDALSSVDANFDGTKPYHGAPKGPYLH